MNIFNIKYDDFILNISKYDKYLSNNNILLRQVIANKDNQLLKELILNLEKYFAFACEVLNSSYDESQVNNIRHANIRNINVTTLNLIRDTLTLLKQFSIYGVNALVRMIIENTVTVIALETNDIDTSEKYYEWQIQNQYKYMKSLDETMKSENKTEEFINNYEKCKTEHLLFSQKYKDNNLFKNDYGWAYKVINKDIESSIYPSFNQLVKYTFPILETFIIELNNYIHSTSLLVYNEQLDKISNGELGIKDIYKKIFTLITMSIDTITSSHFNLIKEQKQNISLEDINKINGYYVDKIMSLNT